MTLIVDIQIVVMLVYWFVFGDSMRYPIILAIIGISKILLNVKLKLSRFFFRLK